MSERLIDLLDAQHKALLEGRFDDLPALSDAMERAMTEADAHSGTGTALIHQKALRNKACLAAALSGIKFAQGRIREITKAARGLTTYDAKGATCVLTNARNPGRRA